MKSFFEFSKQIEEGERRAARMVGASADPRFGMDVFYAGVRRGPDGYKIKFTGPQGKGEEFVADAKPIKKELLSDPQLQGMEGVAIKFTNQDGTVYKTVMPLPQWQAIWKDIVEKKHGSYGRIAGQQMQQTASGALGAAARPTGI